MKYSHKTMTTIGLMFSLTFMTSVTFADLTLNLTQANQHGFDLDALENTLQSVSDVKLELSSNDLDEFSDKFDLVSLNATQAEKACKDNQLLNLTDFPQIKPLLKKSQYLFKNDNDCAVSFASFSLVIAYPLFNMVTTRPESPADFFDVDRFPGTRALPDSPVGTLEWALLSYGIPINEVYQLLSTKRGLKLAFAKLDSIKRHIIWWKDIDELKYLIQNNQVSMATGPHTVFYDLQFNQPMEILWNGQLLIEMKLGINAESKNVDQALSLMSTLMSDSPQFKLAYEFAIGPTNKKTLKTLSLLPQAGQILVFVPTYKKNMQNVIWMDYYWHETLSEIINEKFLQWRNQDSE